MENISIVKGNPYSLVGGKLNIMVLGNMTHMLVGTSNSILIENTLNELWKQKLNRFSHQYVFEAQLNRKTVGLIICYPVSVLNKLAWPTVQKLVKLRKLKFIKYILLHLRDVWSLLDLNEGRIDEYHISSSYITRKQRAWYRF